MSGCEKFIEQISKQLPDLASTGDLIRVGIFKNHQAAYIYRQNGRGPSYFKMSQKTVYPKESVIEFLRNCKVESTTENIEV